MSSLFGSTSIIGHLNLSSPSLYIPFIIFEELIDFFLECGAEEIFAEPINGRGPGLKRTAEHLRAAGFSNAAEEVNRVRSHQEWSRYTMALFGDIREVLAARLATDKLRFLLYPANLTPSDREWVQNNMDGVKWLGKATAHTN